MDNALHLTLCSRIHSFTCISCHFCELPLPFNVLLRMVKALFKLSYSAFVRTLLFLLAVLADDKLSLVPEQLEVNDVNSPVQVMVQGAVSRKPPKLFGPVKPLQNLESWEYIAVLFTYSKDEGRFPSYKKFRAFTLHHF